MDLRRAEAPGGKLLPGQPRPAPSGCAFSAWLWRQRGRPDGVGQLADVVAQDPFWEGADTRADAVAHLARYGVKPEVQRVMGRAWDEYADAGHVQRKRAKAAAKRAMAKRARRRNRR